MLENLLFTCGLNHTEQIVFLFLLKNGPNIASNIARKTKLKRPTAYAGLDTLVRFGLVLKHQKGSVNYFSSVAPQLIPKIFENRAKEQFQDVQSAAKILSPQLMQMAQGVTYEIEGFEVSAVESAEVIYAQLKQALLKGNFSAIFNPQIAFQSDTFCEVVIDFLSQTAQKKPHIREIIVKGPMADWYKKSIKNPNHRIKEIPAEKKFFSDIILVDGSVIISNYDPKTRSGIKIRDKHYFTSMMTLFEMLWASG